ncbi:MAG: acetyl-coenzyme A synthetase N-terminal domain-containing protein, partial [Pseudomonadota bacterium]
MTERPLWSPSPARIKDTNVVHFMARVQSDWGAAIPDYAALHRFSTTETEKFWLSFKDFAGIKAETWGETVLQNGDRMPGATFFPDARLNYAENLLVRNDDSDAFVFWGEAEVRRRMSWRELRQEV